MLWDTLLSLISVLQLVFAASQGFVEMPLRYTKDSMYLVDSVNVGRKDQVMKGVILDTGSADLVLTKSTYKYKKSLFKPEYVSQYGSSEQFLLFEHQDKIFGPGWTVKKATLGVTNITDIDSFYGVFGVGYPALEAMDAYDNFPLELQNQGLISRVMYSIKGLVENPSIVFGGVDSAAYEGPLVKTDIGLEIGPHSTREFHTVIAVTVNSMSLSTQHKPVKISDQKLIYTLDTGSNGLAVPEPIYNNLLNGLAAKKRWKNKIPYFKYVSLREIDLTFNITGFLVPVPVADLIDECDNFGPDKYCSLRIATVDIGVNSYEGTIPNCLFKYIYTVVDLESNQVFMAKHTKSGSTTILPVSGSSYPVPTATAPAYLDTYSSMYQADTEVAVNGHKHPDKCRR